MGEWGRQGEIGKEREGGSESRYVLWVSNDRESKKKKKAARGRNVEGEVLRQNEKTREQKCERVLQRKRDSVTSKKPVAADTERGTDPVPPPPWVNNHHKPWLCLMNPLPMS